MGCSARGVFNWVAAHYDEVAANEARAEHPLPGCGRCIFTMLMRGNGHGFMANFPFRLLSINLLTR
jgi:hypothetical protein